ncbi:hypothetical protein ACFRAR_04305 [Kitasatospora sp. NPDC056651]|uniref:hypothetical protein n=1 Tax=Kitasatospora sp. NPDC056651 TaxID=3345892 RepID=UPI0036982E39
MSTSGFDLAVGMSSDALNAAIKQLHDAHRPLFKGEEGEGEKHMVWDVAKPPKVVAAPPADGEWAKATDLAGNCPPAQAKPADGGFQITLTATSAKVGTASQNLINGKDVVLYGSLSVSEGKIAMKIDAVRTDLSGLTEWDKEPVEEFLVKAAALAQASLPGFAIPTEELFGTKIALTADTVQTTGTHVVATALLAASSKSGAAAEGGPDDTWPTTTKNLWVLLSKNLVEKVLGAVLDDQVAQGKAGKPGTASKAEGPWLATITYTLDSYKNLTVKAEDLSASADLKFGYGAELKSPVLPDCAAKKASDALQ